MIDGVWKLLGGRGGGEAPTGEAGVASDEQGDENDQMDESSEEESVPETVNNDKDGSTGVVEEEGADINLCSQHAMRPTDYEDHSIVPESASDHGNGRDNFLLHPHDGSRQLRVRSTTTRAPRVISEIQGGSVSQGPTPATGASSRTPLRNLDGYEVVHFAPIEGDENYLADGQLPRYVALSDDPPAVVSLYVPPRLMDFIGDKITGPDLVRQVLREDGRILSDEGNARLTMF